MNKIRLDILVAQKAGVSRTIAKDFIEAGLVSVNGKVHISPGTKVDKNINIQIERTKDLFVSRAGNKLKAAIEAYHIHVNSKICLDVGASTGGFTHCLLKFGALKIYAVDTGTDQLNPMLKENPKVISMEKTNINHIETLPQLPEIAVVDVSFVSIKKIFKSVLRLTGQEAEIICLIKPQFEAGRSFVNKKGIVKNKKAHVNVLIDYYDYFRNENLCIKGVMASPIIGGVGNKEYLIYLSKNNDKNTISKLAFADYVERAVHDEENRNNNK